MSVTVATVRGALIGSWLGTMLVAVLALAFAETNGPLPSYTSDGLALLVGVGAVFGAIFGVVLEWIDAARRR